MTDSKDALDRLKNQAREEYEERVNGSHQQDQATEDEAYENHDNGSSDET